MKLRHLTFSRYCCIQKYQIKRKFMNGWFLFFIIEIFFYNKIEYMVIWWNKIKSYMIYLWIYASSFLFRFLWLSIIFFKSFLDVVDLSLFNSSSLRTAIVQKYVWVYYGCVLLNIYGPYFLFFKNDKLWLRSFLK